MIERTPHLPDGAQLQECLLFGGSFNPLTLAHVAAIEALLDFYPDSPLLIMPSAARNDKPDLKDDIERVEMLQLAAHDRNWSDRVIITDFEMRLPRPSNTYQTLKALGRAGVENLRFVLGVDSVNTLPTWEEGDKLLKEVSWVIVQRYGYELEVEPHEYDWVELPSHDGISSTQVREAVQQGEAMGGFVTPSVQWYIEENGLYKEVA